MTDARAKALLACEEAKNRSESTANEALVAEQTLIKAQRGKCPVCGSTFTNEQAHRHRRL